jgi:hypothetical protein
MKKLLLILTLMLSLSAWAQKPCPVVGESHRATDQFSDSLKNRNLTSDKVTQAYIGMLLQKGNDINRFTYGTYVRMRGMITEVKHGGSELCNCHSTEKLDMDIHIVFSDSLGQGKIICEVNRYTQAQNKVLSYSEVHALIGKQVYIIGWLFWDGEHKQNATNTCTTCTNVWRDSCWEIHPVMFIEVIE